MHLSPFSDIRENVKIRNPGHAVLHNSSTSYSCLAENAGGIVSAALRLQQLCTIEKKIIIY